MEPVTAEQCRATAQEKGLFRANFRPCSICGYMTAYLFSDDLDEVAFDAGCNCGVGRTLRKTDWADFANAFNINTPEHRATMWQRFIDGNPLIGG